MSNQLMIDIPCIILAGGKSKRMGEDKSLINFLENRSLIKYQYDRLATIFSDLYISSKTNKFDFPCQIIYDKKEEDSSPMIALDAIFSVLKQDKVFLIPVDSPFVEVETIKELIEKSNNPMFEVTICADKKKTHNLIGVYKRSIMDKVVEMLNENNHKINYLLTKKIKTQVITFENSDQFINLNTPEDLQRLHK